MRADPLAPIPIPLRQRWHDMRQRLLPALVFVAAIAAIAGLWRNHIAAPTMVGQVEGDLASLSSPKSGMLTGLHVVRFQKVRAGELLGHVLVADPRLLETSLAVARAEIEALRAGLRPIAMQQRNAVNYVQLRLDWMKQRATLAGAQVNLQFAEVELGRTEELFKDKIISQHLLDQAKARHDALQHEVEELTKLVAEGERSFKSFQPGDARDLATVSDEPLRAAIAVQESRLRMTEAELSPIRLYAPIGGTVTVIHHYSGEAVTPGLAILEIAADKPTRIVGYLRPPLLEEPKVGMRVEVRTRGLRREVAPASVLVVGTQYEPVPGPLQSPVKFAAVELGLPLDISLPSSLKIRPGELVDLTFLTESD